MAIRIGRGQCKHQQTTQAKQCRHGRGARQGQTQQAQRCCAQMSPASAMGGWCQAEKQQTGEAQLAQRRRDFMRKLCKTQTAQQGQQTAVCQCSGVVGGASLPSERESHRLCCSGPRQRIDTVPGGHQCQDQHAHERQACRSAFPSHRSEPNEPCTQPGVQQGQAGLHLSRQHGSEPADRAAIGAGQR